MRRRVVIPLALLGVLTVILLGSGTFRSSEPGGNAVEISAGPLEVWTSYDGVIEARKLWSVLFASGGAATVMEMVPEGGEVKKGDVLVRFDASQFEQEALKLEQEVALARAEWDSALNGRFPLEIRDLEVRLVEARTQHESERQFLEDNRELLREGLVSGQEVKQQEAKAAAAKAQVESLELQLKLTREHLHPAARDRIEAMRSAAEQQLSLARERLKSATVPAPVDGLVVYKPVHVGGEFRIARVGDTIYRNQAFMVIPEMQNPVVQCDVPEAELSRVQAGNEVVVIPAAYPDVRLQGTVESVGSMAQAVAGKPTGQRFFRVMIALNGSDERLRAGMSVRARIRSYANPNALRVPRVAVSWEGDAPHCEVVRGRARERRPLELGRAGDQYYEVRAGLEPGERVWIP
jgi:multidrug efflux pump subunit AcrA (membrane-fusion protein)